MELHVALSLRLDAIEAHRLANAYRAEVLRNEASNLRRVEREEVPEGALGTKTGLLKAALILDERADLIGEKATASAATATPAEPTGRVAQLLEAIRTHRGEWTTKRVQDLYRLSPLAPPNAPDGRLRHVARGDLRDLCAWGHLVLHEESGRRFYTLKFRKDATK
jgi:alpha-D-ribose 1-methylphosphonate 5-triphosphate synthase subunit PhnI